jgi:hypothetical protein
MADDDVNGHAPKPAKSETRQRTDRLFVRLTPEEKAIFLGRADKAGLTAAAFLRAAAIGNAGPRAQKKVPADAQALREMIGHLGKIGSNLNQIARYLHTGGSAEVVLSDIRNVLADHARIRDRLYEALGKTPDHAPPVDPTRPQPPKR